jgi:hypothetical protein
MLTTDQKGAVAELAVALAASKLGVGVYRPVNDGERYDMILEVHGYLLRVQCKSAQRYADGVVIRCYSSRRARTGLVRRVYTCAEVDAIAAYSADLDRCFLVPMTEIEGHRELRLRLEPARNNQRQGIRWGDDFDFADRIRELEGP